MHPNTFWQYLIWWNICDIWYSWLKIESDCGQQPRPCVKTPRSIREALNQSFGPNHKQPWNFLRISDMVKNLWNPTQLTENRITLRATAAALCENSRFALGFFCTKMCEKSKSSTMKLYYEKCVISVYSWLKIESHCGQQPRPCVKTHSASGWEVTVNSEQWLINLLKFE